MDVIEACCLLFVTPECDSDEIKQRFRMEASEWHPDRGGDTQAMQRINEAREYLLSTSKESRLREWRRLKGHMSDIMERIDAERDAWEARRAAKASVTNTETPLPEPKPSVTNKRRAAVTRPRNIYHIEVILLNNAVQMCVNEVLAGCRTPMSKQ